MIDSNLLGSEGGYPAIENDEQLFGMMQQDGFWEQYDASPEMQGQINSYMSQEDAPAAKAPAKIGTLASTGLPDYSSLGMDALKDMTTFSQAQPIQGLMSMAQYNNKPKGLFR